MLHWSITHSTQLLTIDYNHASRPINTSYINIMSGNKQSKGVVYCKPSSNWQWQLYCQVLPNGLYYLPQFPGTTSHKWYVGNDPSLTSHHFITSAGYNSNASTPVLNAPTLPNISKRFYALFMRYDTVIADLGRHLDMIYLLKIFQLQRASLYLASHNITIEA